VRIDQAGDDRAAAEIDDAGRGPASARMPGESPIAAILPSRTANACAGAPS